MPELQHQDSSRLLTAPGSSAGNAASAGLAVDDSTSGLASSFKDKVKIEKKHGTSESQPGQKKKVTVEEASGKIKSTGAKANKKPDPKPTLVSRFYLYILSKFLQKQEFLRL